MRIHIIDLSKTQESYPRFKRDFGPAHECIYINGFKDPYPAPAEADVIVLTGSEYSITQDYPWLDPLMRYVRKVYECGKPMLGICYSHQLIARALAGKEAVGKASRPEVTFAPIEITQPHPVFEGLPNPFRVMSSHYDQVCHLPEGFAAVARSKDCPIQAMAHRDKPVVGMQFHPEMDTGEGRESLRGEWDKLKTHGLDPEELLAQIPIRRTGAERVLKNFITYVQRKPGS